MHLDFSNPEPGSLAHYLLRGSVSFFGCRGPFPDFLDNAKGRARAFVARQRALPETSRIEARRYASLSEVREERSDVYFLDHEATKVLFAEFPATARFVLIRLSPRLAWLLALPGLLRRLQKKLVCVDGVVTLRAKGKAQRWLVLRHKLRDTLHTRLSLSEEVGVQGFLDHLRRTGANYVVLRFFEKLPALYREGGDLDLLVSDEDEQAIKAYLQEHPGPIRVDVWSVSRTSFNDITYYPPPLARGILERAVDGPAHARVPSAEDAFRALAYHALYHKGLFAGVPTSLTGLSANPDPENDYAESLARMASALRIEVPITMEALDEYLASVGWQPKLDTLAKIAPRNAWVWARFFSAKQEREVGLGVFIIKRKALMTGVAEKIRAAILATGEYRILKEKTLSDEEVATVARELRGGVWSGKDGSDDFLPAQVLVVLDLVLAKAARLGVAHALEDKRIRALKRELRRSFDTEKTSFTHSTDWTHEAREYIRVCFPGMEDALLLEAAESTAALRVSPVERLVALLRHLPREAAYRYARAMRSLRHRLIRAALVV